MNGTFLDIDFDDYDNVEKKDNTGSLEIIDFDTILENTPDKKVELLEGFEPVNIGLDEEHYHNQIKKRILNLSEREQDEIIAKSQYYLERFKILKNQRIEDIDLSETEDLKEFLHLVTGEVVTDNNFEALIKENKQLPDLLNYFASFDSRLDMLQFSIVQNNEDIKRELEIQRLKEKINKELTLLEFRLNKIKNDKKNKKGKLSNKILGFILSFVPKVFLVFFILFFILYIFFMGLIFLSDSGLVNKSELSTVEVDGKLTDTIIKEKDVIKEGLPNYDFFKMVYDESVGKLVILVSDLKEK